MNCPVCGKGAHERAKKPPFMPVSHLDCVRQLELDRNKYKRMYEEWGRLNAERADRNFRRAEQAEAEVERLRWMLDNYITRVVKGSGYYRPEEAMDKLPEEHLAELKAQRMADLIRLYEEAHR